MSLLANIIGFSFVGLAARMGQLAIKKQNVFTNPGGHLISMGAFGFAGYWAYQWDQRAGVLLAEKRAELSERRRNALAQVEEAAAAALADSE